MPRYELKQGDFGFMISGELTNENGVASITDDTTILFRMKPADGQTSGPTISRPAEVLDAATAEVGYEWQEGDTDVPGVYIAEFFVVYTPTSVETFPSGESAGDFIQVIIKANAAA